MLGWGSIQGQRSGVVEHGTGLGHRSMVVGREKGVTGRWGEESGCSEVGGQGRRPVWWSDADSADSIFWYARASAVPCYLL